MKQHIYAAITVAVALAGCGENKDSAGEGAPAQTAPPEARSGAPAEIASEPAADPAAEGKKRFSACAVCHGVKASEPSRVGPNLFGVVGEAAASVEDFAYSDAMRSSGIIWSEENLDGFIENPQKFISGNRMAYPGERDPEKRAAIISYLTTLKPAED